MALPVGIVTATVRFGPMIDDQGTPFTGKVSFTASRPKVWAATGTPLLPRALTVVLDETGQGEIVLPATDQDGFTDGAGNAVKDWTYRAQVDLNGRSTDVRSFQLPTEGQSGVVLDLDLMTPVPSSTGVVVSLPSVLNVAGLTGAITPSALAAALEPELPAPPTPKIPVAGAGTGILATLADFQTGARALGYAGDSTMNDGQDWPRAFLKMYGAATADGLGIVERQWNTTTEAYGSPITIKAGEESEATGGTILDDPFTSAVGDLSGAAIPTGGTWTGTGWSSSGGSAKGSTTAALTFDTGSKDHTNAAHMVVVTSAANPAPQLRVYAGASTAAPHSAGNYVWAQLVVSTGGAVSLSVWKRIGGTNTQIVATDNATGIVANSATPQNVTVSIELAIQQVTVRLKVGSAEEKVYNGTVTEGDYAVLGTYAGYATLNNTTSALLLDRAVMAVPETPGQMSGLTVWNAAAAGKTLAYHRDRLAAMYPDPLDVLVVSMGHNYGTQSPASFIADVESFLTAFKAAHPETTVVLSSQNPQKAPSLTVAAHAARQAALRDFAFVNGYEYLPGYETFAALPSGGAAFIGPDGIHPTSPTFGTLEDSGAVRWAQAWFDRVENTRLL